MMRKNTSKLILNVEIVRRLDLEDLARVGGGLDGAGTRGVIRMDSGAMGCQAPDAGFATAKSKR